MQLYSVVILATLVAAVVATEYYSGKWNDFSAEPVIDNDRLFPKYVMCITANETTVVKGCPPAAKDLRKVLPEVMETSCEKCSPAQIEKIKKILSYICKKRPEDFARIIAKIDPEGKYRPVLEDKFGKIDGGC